MFIDKNSIKINNISMGQYLLAVKYSYNKLWGDDTGRNMDGDFSGTLKGTFPKITLTFRKLTKDETNLIAPILDSGNQSLTYYDPTLNRLLTINTYAGDWEYENNRIANKTSSFSISLIAKERRPNQ